MTNKTPPRELDELQMIIDSIHPVNTGRDSVEPLLKIQLEQILRNLKKSHDTLQAELDEAKETIARLNSEGVILMAHDVYEVLKQKLERAESLLKKSISYMEQDDYQGGCMVDIANEIDSYFASSKNSPFLEV